MEGRNRTPLIVHVISRLAVGGMENGIVNLLNHAPPDRYRHAIICLRDFSEFRNRITRDDVEVYALGKQGGNHPGSYFRLWRLLRRLRPDLVHTRNLPTIDLAPVIRLAGIRHIVHGEHGRDMVGISGRNRKYNLIRRFLSPLVRHYIAVSRDIAGWLENVIGVPSRKISQIYNGVDTEKFFPPGGSAALLPDDAGALDDAFVIGTVGRMETVKDQTTLARAFIQLCNEPPCGPRQPFLVLVGDGSLRQPAEEMLEKAGFADRAWLPGNRDDVPEILRCFDLFVLPSLNEGISNTIIEAMVAGLPVVATRVGGNPELVTDGDSGILVPPGDPDSMAAAIAGYIDSPALAEKHGKAGYERVSEKHSMQSMVDGYLSVYDRVLNGTVKVDTD